MLLICYIIERAPKDGLNWKKKTVVKIKYARNRNDGLIQLAQEDSKTTFFRPIEWKYVSKAWGVRILQYIFLEFVWKFRLENIFLKMNDRRIFEQQKNETGISENKSMHLFCQLKGV